MSMQAWDVPNPNDNGAFNPNLDPGMAFANTPTSSNFDYSMQNAQLQRMQNGNMRNGNGSPASFQHQMYQTSSVIPSKRPHEFTGSPRQASRSQTPQQGPYPGFTGAVNGQTPNPYQHLQHQASSNTSPSPIMQNQQFTTPGMPPRMQTASPSPFSPAGPNFAPQASPVQSDYGSRVDTPSNGAQAFMQGNPYANGMNVNAQSFTPPPGNMVAGFPGASMPAYNPNNMPPEQQRNFQLKQQQLMQQLQAGNVAAQQRHPMANANPMMNNPNQMAIQQAMRQQNARTMQQVEHMLRNPEEFARGVAHYMAMKNQPFVKEAIIGGRPVHAVSVFAQVIRSGGAKRVTMTNGWPQIAAALSLHPSAAPELSTYWHHNLAIYEAAFQQRTRMQLQAMQNDPNAVAGQAVPGRPANYTPEAMAAMHARRQSGANFQTPSRGPMAGQQDSRQTQMNGFSPPHPAQQQHPGMTQQGLPPQQKAQRTQQPDGTNVADKKKAASIDRSTPAAPQSSLQPGVRKSWYQPLSSPMSDTFKPKLHQTIGRDKAETSPQETHGGIFVQSAELKEMAMELTRYRPDFPDTSRYGNIDIHAVTMSLKSGLPGEVRLALNILSALSCRAIDPARRLPPLVQCDDLLETLIDCAEAQLDILADHAPEVSDVVQLSPYEELVRSTTSDITALQDVPEFASLEYDLDQAAERLLCISALIRNFSHEYEVDKELVADQFVVKFIATIVRYLGTRNNLLRSNRNTLDFSKDAVLYLSNVAQYIAFSGKEEAQCILQFLLSFAPLPQPTVSESNQVVFPVYEPSQHRYVPAAIQALAKLLACGDPNRSFLKSIFATDLASTPCLDLLTRAFGLCIAPLPALASEAMARRVELRARFLTQGLLAADSLTSFIPTAEHSLAHAWLASEDGFAQRLLRVILEVGIRASPNQQAINQARQRHAGHPQHGPPPPNDDGSDMITSYGVSILHKLAERAKDVDTLSGSAIASSETFKHGVLLQALRSLHIDPKLLQQLSTYASLDD